MMFGFSIDQNYHVNQKKDRERIFTTYDLRMYRVPYEARGKFVRCAWRVVRPLKQGQ